MALYITPATRSNFTCSPNAKYGNSTFLVVMRRTVDSTSNSFFMRLFNAAGNAVSGHIGAAGGSNRLLSQAWAAPSLSFTAAEGWCAIALTKAGGASIPTYWKFNYQTGVAQIENAGPGATEADLASVGPGGFVQIGYSTAEPHGHYAAVALYGRVLDGPQLFAAAQSLSAMKASNPDWGLFTFDGPANSAQEFFVGGTWVAGAGSTPTVSAESSPFGYGDPVIFQETVASPGVLSVDSFASATWHARAPVQALASSFWGSSAWAISPASATWTTLQRVGSTFGDGTFGSGTFGSGAVGVRATWNVAPPANTVVVVATTRWTVHRHTDIAAARSRWTVLYAVTDSPATARWAATQGVQASVTARWSTTQSGQAIAAVAAHWSISQGVQAIATARWATAQGAHVTATARWAATQGVQASVTARWSTRVVAGATAHTTWGLRGAVTGTTAARWMVLHAVTVTRTARWDATGSIAAPAIAGWSVRCLVRQPASATWAQRQVVLTAANARYQLLFAITVTAHDTWALQLLPAPHVRNPKVAVSSGQCTVDVANGERTVEVKVSVCTVA